MGFQNILLIFFSLEIPLPITFLVTMAKTWAFPFFQNMCANSQNKWFCVWVWGVCVCVCVLFLFLFLFFFCTNNGNSQFCVKFLNFLIFSYIIWSLGITNFLSKIMDDSSTEVSLNSRTVQKIEIFSGFQDQE